MSILSPYTSLKRYVLSLDLKLKTLSADLI